MILNCFLGVVTHASNEGFEAGYLTFFRRHHYKILQGLAICFIIFSSSMSNAAHLALR